MAQGGVRDATAWYARARSVARALHPRSRRLDSGLDALAMELEMERGRLPTRRLPALPRLAELRGVWNEPYCAGVEVVAELALRQDGSGGAVRYLTRTLHEAREAGEEGLEKYVAALLVCYLGRAGRAGKAGRVVENSQLGRWIGTAGWGRRFLEADRSRLLRLGRAVGQPRGAGSVT